MTSGPGSDGILAQSIGGGGGTGGGANSLSLQLATSCTFTTPAFLKFPQIGNCKAPKKPSVNVQVDVGGFGGTGNNGGDVTVTNHSFITTLGEFLVGHRRAVHWRRRRQWRAGDRRPDGPVPER